MEITADRQSCRIMRGGGGVREAIDKQIGR